MKWLLLFSFFLSSCSADEPSIAKVGIVDTGINLKNNVISKVLCKSGHDDFTGTGLKDTHGHGTLVASLIQKYAKTAKYCLVICKFWDERVKNNNSIIGCFQKLVNEGVSIINFSGGGPQKSPEEEEFIAKYPHVTFVVAAGNEGSDMDKGEKYYPACLDLPNVISVGSIEEDGSRSKFSNYGSMIDAWEIGDAGVMRGTSFSTAVHTGKIVYENFK